jgi:hypothetical protein
LDFVGKLEEMSERRAQCDRRAEQSYGKRELQKGCM